MVKNIDLRPVVSIFSHIINTVCKLVFLWHEIRFTSFKGFNMNRIKWMNGSMTVLIYRGIILGLCIASIVFGVVLPRSLADHENLLHFSAHFGMSFLIAHAVYRFCSAHLPLKKMILFIKVFAIAFCIGVIYKLFEIQPCLNANNMPYFKTLMICGFFTSMSQNLGGIFAAFALIIYFDDLLPFRKKAQEWLKLQGKIRWLIFRKQNRVL
jgi:hypothetical protein